MSNTILRRRERSLLPILSVSVFLIAATALAATQLVTAKKGGEIDIAPGVVLKILPNALNEDTVISADIVRKGKRVCFEFQPSGVTFAKPALLGISWEAINESDIFGGLDGLILYTEDGSAIEPKVTGQGVTYRIEHFSIYYFRRR